MIEKEVSNSRRADERGSHVRRNRHFISEFWEGGGEHSFFRTLEGFALTSF
jgi:hypothetical protein